MKELVLLDRPTDPADRCRTWIEERYVDTRIKHGFSENIDLFILGMHLPTFGQEDDKDVSECDAY